MSDQKITSQQIKKIHTLISKLRMSDNDYRLMLSDYWVDTSKDLNYEEAEDLISKLEKEAISKGLWSRYSQRGKMRYEDVGNRPGMASPKQLRMIEAMWKDASYMHDPTKRQIALRHFIFRITGKDDLRFLASVDARKVIEAIGRMMHKHGPIKVFRDRSNNF